MPRTASPFMFKHQFIFGLSILFILFSASPILGQAEPRQETDSSLEVMTFNIRFNNPRDGENAWPHRRDHVAQLIQEYQVDIVGIQEALGDQIDDLEERLEGYEWIGVGRDDGKQGGEYVPIFYRTERLEKLAAGHFWLSKSPQTPGSKSWDTAITRMATWAKFRDRETDQQFMLVNTHFDHVGEEARRESASLIRNQVHQLSDSLPVVLTGDFNCNPDSEPVKRLTVTETEAKPFRDTRLHCQADPEGPVPTWNGFGDSPRGQRIDFVFVQGPIKILAHRTIDIQYDGRYPSDHLPVTVTLDLPKE